MQMSKVNQIKITQLVLLVLSLVSALILWLTRSEWLPSMSAFALSENVIYYIIMHICMIMFWFFESANNGKGLISFIAFFNIGILAFNMYDDLLLHNIFTALTVICGVANLIYVSKGLERSIAILIGVISGLFFLSGLFTSLHLFLAEAVVIFVLGSGYIRKMWITK